MWSRENNHVERLMKVFEESVAGPVSVNQLMSFLRKFFLQCTRDDSVPIQFINKEIYISQR
jgi:hypothetical protein